MIKLTMEFKSLEEVADFVASNTGVPTTAKVDVPPVMEESKEEDKDYSDDELLAMSDKDAKKLLSPGQKGKRTKLKKAAKKADQEAEQVVEEAQPAMQPEANAASVFGQAPVAPAPVQAAPTVDRNAYIEEATKLVGQMRQLGVSDEEVMPKLQQAYAQVGVPFTKFSLLEDHNMPMVYEQLKQVVAALSNGQNASGLI